MIAVPILRVLRVRTVLFQDRFKSEQVEDDKYFLIVQRSSKSN